MFNSDFFPTPYYVIQTMLEGAEIANKVILEPSAGKGDIVDYLNDNGAAEVLICEKNADLAQIVKTKGKFLKDDFLTLESSDISHIDFIVMNPPFTADERHILHAFNIAPAGCKIISLANANTIKNAYSSSRKELKSLIELYGNWADLGDCFTEAERRTGAEIALIKLTKPGGSYNQEFDGFFMEEEEEAQENGLITYNVIRDLVNRYVESIKIFDEQLAAAGRMNQLTKGYFSVNIGLNISNNDHPTNRAEFKKSMQKSGWSFIFSKLNLQKHTTKGLRDDINKFVEEQTSVPFTMRNIYKMIEIIIGTTGQRMDKAILEVFDKITQHYHENRFNVEGWKTNSHFLLNKRFIVPNVVEVGYRGEIHRCSWSSGNYEKIEDLVKAICYMTGENYSHHISLENFIYYRYKLKNAEGHYLNNPEFKDYDVKVMDNNYSIICKKKESTYGSVIEDSVPEWGQWFEWGYFRCRAYKKGTMHFEFKDADLWARFNHKVAELKGYPLYEKAPDKRTEKQKQKAQQASTEATPKAPAVKPVILGTYKVKV